MSEIEKQEINLKDNNFKIVEKKDFAKHFLFKRFLDLPDPPAKIYVKGIYPGPHLRTVAIVGSRDMTSYGKDALEKIISGLANHSISIISGLALGTDAEAHRQALKNNLHTIAVPGSGLSHKTIYPRANVSLAENILSEGGLLISELAPEEGSAPWTFPQRNRLMAALADVVLMVEAGFKSGTMITARLALEYNRDVLAVPGSIFSRHSNGTNRLISQGAKIVTCAEDVLEALGILVPRADEMLNTHDGGNEMSLWKREYYDKSKTDKEMQSLSEMEKEILSHIKEPTSKDKLLSNSKYDISDVMMSLTLLEMRGFLREEGGILRRLK